jgi:DNA invertase Pin-like site-specific DNA recombinase
MTPRDCSSKQSLKCALLVRSSDDGSAQKQLDALRAFAKRSDYEVAGEFSLGGMSSSDPRYDAALKHIVEREVSRGVTRLLIPNLDVLTRRGPAHGLALIHDLETKGIKLVVLSDLSIGSASDTIRRLIALFMAARQFDDVQIVEASDGASHE